MKSRMPFQNKRGGWAWACALAICAAASKVPAADTNALAGKVVPPLTPQEFFEGGKETYNNWIEIGAGGFFVDGNKSQFQQRHRSGPVFGGIEDFHYSASLTNKTTLTIDGRALYDNEDYKLRVDLTREKLGYLRFYYSEFRTWYNGDGGFDPASGVWNPLGGDALELDRGEFSFEGGLTQEKKPQLAFKYSHKFRDGEKSSTNWGFAHPPGPFNRPTIG